jgi:hypothetical protein
MRHYASTSDRWVDALIILVDTIDRRILFTQIAHVVVGTYALSASIIMDRMVVCLRFSQGTVRMSS